MGRKTLEKQIQALDDQLAIELALLKLDGRERRAALKRVPVLYWVLGGVAGGALIGKLTGSKGPGLLISQGATLFRLATLMSPAGATVGSELAG